MKDTEGLTSKDKVGLLHDHYKDTFSHLRKYMDKRDKLTVTIIIITVLLVLSIIDGALVNDLINNWFNGKVESPKGEHLTLGVHIINNTLLLVLLINLLTYYRLINLITSQLDYIQELEKEMNTLVGTDNFISREGGQYKSLPKFVRNFSRFTYIIVLPIFITFLVIVNACEGWNNTLMVSNILNIVLSACVVIVTILQIFNSLK